MKDSPSPSPPPNMDWRPVPDPTTLTTAQSRDLRDEMFRALAAVREILEARFDATDQATERFRTNLPKDLNAHIDTVEKLFTEKLIGHETANEQRFKAIDLRFNERSERHSQMQAMITSSIDARFASQEKADEAASASNDKAIAKTETATKEKIDALQALLTGSINDIRGQISTLTSRQDRAEGASKGVVESVSDRRGQAGMVIGISSLAALVISMIVGATLFVVNRSNLPSYSPAAYPPAAVVPLGPTPQK